MNTIILTNRLFLEVKSKLNITVSYLHFIVALTEGSLRLVDSEAVRYGGNLQIFVNGQWRYVKSREWSVNEASVTCRQMGFKSYNTVHNDSFSVSSLSQSRPLCNFACDGTERRLLECISSGLCNGNETYIGIVCSRSNATSMFSEFYPCSVCMHGERGEGSFHPKLSSLHPKNPNCSANYLTKAILECLSQQ